RGVTYVKSFDENKWLPEKKYAIKTNTRTIGKINSGNGAGLILFEESFLKSRPEYKDIAIVRYYDEEQKKWELRIEEDHSSEIITSLKVNSRHEVTDVISVGTYLLFTKLIEKDTLLESLKSVFPDTYKQLLSLAYYCLDECDFKSNRYALYAKEHKLPYQVPLTPTAITRLFQSVTEADELNFFSHYFESLYKANGTSRRRFWALDSTSISTYSKYLDAKFGHNKQEENIPQINIVLLTDQKTGRPLYYSRFNGSIPDISTVSFTFDNLLHIGARSFVAVMDRGYYSNDNLNEILSCGYHFLICVPLDKVDTFKDVLLEAAQAFICGDKYESAIDENVFTKKIVYEYKNKGKKLKKDLFVHVFYDQERAGAVTKHIQKRRVEVMKMLKEHMTLDGNNQSFAKKYLIQEENGLIRINNEAFQEANSKAGIFVCVSDCIGEGKQAFYGYKDRRTVEDCFNDLKVKMSCDRFNTSSEESLPGKCFVEFIALSLHMRIEYLLRKMKENGVKLPHHSVRTILRDLQGIKTVEFGDGYSAVKTISRTQKETLKLFHVPEPVSQYRKNIAVPNMIKHARKPH
ncbi:MAG: IS1634 family transposase, partial [Succinivibrio dextrinosolvens]|nr:IS1634 family transposase [Succinivibrio dextrinosolvens]